MEGSVPFFHEPVDTLRHGLPSAKADAQAKDQIVAFYKEHNPAKLADVDGLIAKYKSAGVDVATLFEAIKKKYDAAK